METLSTRRGCKTQKKQVLHRKFKKDEIVTLLDVSRPTKLGQFVDAAAQCLYRNGIVDNNIIVTGTKLYKHKVSFSDVLATQFHLRSPDANVINAGKAWTTSSESRKGARLAKKKGLKKMAVVTLGIHKKRTEIIVRNIKGIEIEVLAAEDVLTNPNMHCGGEKGERKAAKYAAYFERLKQTSEYQEFARHEKEALPKTIFVEKWHLARAADLYLRLRRPKVMSK